MPARDDGMKVVKSRRGHGAVSPETARANARKRREAQRRNEAGRNVFTGLDDDAKEEAPPPEVRRRKPEAPPPPPPKDNSPKQKPPKARRKKAAADDGFVDYAGDLRERVVGVASIVLMTCVWFLPALLYVLRTPHDFSRERFHAVPPPPLRFEILQPAREKLATSEVLEWRLSEDLTRRASATTVGVEIWLDGTRLLEQNLTMPRAGKTEAGDLELSRLTYGLGHLQMGIHNVTVVLGSAERPPRFDACSQNTSLFLSTTVGEPSRAAVPATRTSTGAGPSRRRGSFVYARCLMLPRTEAAESACATSPAFFCSGPLTFLHWRGSRRCHRYADDVEQATDGELCMGVTLSPRRFRGTRAGLTLSLF